jgi:hypothetical protein
MNSKLYITIFLKFSYLSECFSYCQVKIKARILSLLVKCISILFSLELHVLIHFFPNLLVSAA